jgi:divalent metal cation (Fe/Co/Zn/Cd) transporter
MKGKEARSDETPIATHHDAAAALRVEAATIAWMVVEAGVAIGSGIVARSLLLVAFGADSVIELISAVVLWRRLRVEAVDPARTSDIERAEQRASRIAGGLLYALAVYVVIAAAIGFLHRSAAGFSLSGLIVTAIAAFGMPVLARAKLRLADRLASAALRADAMESLTCGYLSWLVLAGLAANAVFHLWWLDSAASLVIVPLLVKEAREAVTGHCACHD